MCKIGKTCKCIVRDISSSSYYVKEVKEERKFYQPMIKTRPRCQSFVANDEKWSFQSKQEAGKMQHEQIRPQSPTMRQMGPKL